MEFLFFIGMVALAIYFATKNKNTKADSTQEKESEWEKELKLSQQRLAAALGACQSDHPEATDALCWLAGSDGTVSKQELRTIFRFCEEQGTKIEKMVFKDIDNLNAGLSMSVKTNESQAHELLKTMSAKPASYRLAFFGVVNKLCGTQKKISSTKQRFLKASEELATNG